MRFSRSGRKSKTDWKWGSETIEEVKTFKYLGYTFQSNCSPNAHLSAVKDEAYKKMGEVWGIGERRFKNRFDIRIKMFDCLIKSGLLYGAEIYGYRERNQIELTQRKYIKWTLGLAQTTKNAIVLTETGRTPLSLEAACIAMRYEIKIEQGPSDILREALTVNTIDDERREFYANIGWSHEMERHYWKLNRTHWFEACELNKTKILQTIEEDIKMTEYNNHRPAQKPEYLNAGKDIKLIARFRCGNEERGKDSWRTHRDRLCRICGTEEETINHMMTTCTETGLTEAEILCTTGRGQEWMKEVLRARN